MNKSDILNHKDINEDVVINEINNFCGHNTILNNADYSVKISDLTFSYIKDENNAPVVVLDNYNERIKVRRVRGSYRCFRFWKDNTF